MTLTSSATVKAAAFKSGYNPSALASASFTNTITNTIPPASYYVGKNGSDSYSCTQARSSSTPKLTINAGLACIGTNAGAGANQIVEVASGTYVEQIYNNLPTGTSWNAPFTLRAKAGDTVTIKATSNFNLYLGNNVDYFSTVEGFVLDGTNVINTQVFITTSSFVRLKNLQIINTNGSIGIYIDPYAHDIEVLDSKIHDGNFDCTLATPPCPQGTGYPIYLAGHNNLIQGNEIYNAPTFGIHVYSAHPEKPDNNIINRNIVRNVSTLGGSTGGIIIASSGNGNIVSNNLIYNNNSFGIQIALGATNTKVFNNTVYGNAETGIMNWYSNVTGTVIKNNIAWNNRAGQITDQTGNGTTVISNNLTSDPKFVNPTSNNFRVQSGSLAIDTGVNLWSEGVNTDFNAVPRPQICCYDIGAYEQ